MEHLTIRTMPLRIRGVRLVSVSKVQAGDGTVENCQVEIP
jgi:hypothetical protein